VVVFNDHARAWLGRVVIVCGVVVVLGVVSWRGEEI
jgi:hypothetical protein